MMEIGLMVAVFLAGVLVGVIGLGQWEVWRTEREAQEKAAKRKYAAAKSASTRKKKATEKFDSVAAEKVQADSAPVVDPMMYGRKANGEGSWPA